MTQKADHGELTKEGLEAIVERLEGAEHGFHIGQPVQVAPHYEFYHDWLGQTLYVAAIRVYVPAYRSTPDAKLIIDTSDHWPPRHNGDITTDWEPTDLIALSRALQQGGGDA